jgi:hypothetical protein
MAPRLNPLAHVAIPALPTLASDKTNATPTGAMTTNAMKIAASTNAGTNILAAKSTNSPSATNSVVVTTDTNTPPVPNVPPIPGGMTVVKMAGSNASVVTVGPNGAFMVAAAGTNVVSGTNIALTNLPPGVNISNLVASAGTNSSGGKPKRSRNGPNGIMMAGMPGGRSPAPELPADIKARVNRIYDSEILGQIIHPLPMGLIGIAGDMAFLRSPSGQTGLVKEGDSLGDLKLLKIGINRVLVEEDGKKSELMIFDGYGGSSLMADDANTNSAPAQATPGKPARRRAKSVAAEEKDKPE